MYKVSSKLENTIIAETFLLLSVFPCLPNWGNIVPEMEFAFMDENYVSIRFVFSHMIPAQKHCFLVVQVQTMF